MSDQVEEDQLPNVIRGACLSMRASKDLMKAWLSIIPPDEGGATLTAEEILRGIRESGVTYGIKESTVTRLGADPIYNTEILIAEGTAPVHGEDAHIDYKINMDQSGRPLSEDEEGRVNFKELNIIKNVTKDQVIAVKTPATPGKPGVNVRHEIVAARDGRDAKLSAGTNVVLSDDGLEARALVDGGVNVSRGNISVSNVFKVAKSVGSETGNIMFLGSVHIADSIEDGFTVRAAEDVIVGKTVGKAQIDAGGNVKVGGGVVGANEGKIVCGGNFSAKFLQESHVQAKGDVNVGEGILHSHIEAGGSVRVGVGAKRGTIVGGHIRAWKKVACKVLGSPMSTKTLVDVGINPRILAKLEELQSNIVKDRQNYDNIKKGMAALEVLRDKLGGKLPPEKVRIYETLGLGQASFKQKLQTMAMELRELQTQIAMTPDCSVSVHDELYAGVKVSIGTAVYYSTQTEKFITLKEEGGEIRTHTYEEPVEAEEL